jgi:tetratricopeptide (TPR) repeat protein
MITAIQTDLALLTTHNQQFPERHRSLRAVFSASWNLLTPTEQQIAARLSIFQSSFDRHATAQICAADLATLINLADKAFIRQTNTGRYSMHELLRQFAAEQLARTPHDAQHIIQRYSSYYLTFVSDREHRLVYADPRNAVAEIQIESAHLRQAWAWAVSTMQISALVQAAHGVSQFYGLIGHWEEREYMLARACQAAHTTAWQTNSSPLSTTARGYLLSLYSYALLARNNYEHAINIAQQALNLARPGSESELLSSLVCGGANYRQGHLNRAAHQITYALQQSTHVHQNRSPSPLISVIESMALVWLRAIAISQGQYTQAFTYAEQALHLCRSRSQAIGEVQSLCNLADVARETYNLTTARDYYEQALQQATQINFRWLEAVINYELGDVLRLQGHYSHAHTLIATATTIFHELGETTRAYLALALLTQITSYLGLTDDAHTAYEHCISLQGTISAPEIQLQAQLALLIYYQRYRAPQEQLHYAEHCWQLAQSYGHPYTQAYALLWLGHAHATLNQPHATTAYQHARDLYLALNNPAAACAAWAGLAASASINNDAATAQTCVEAILAVHATHPRLGIDEPFLIYHTCWQILHTQHDPRSSAILNAAKTALTFYVNHITDPDQRTLFLSDPIRRTLWEA